MNLGKKLNQISILIFVLIFLLPVKYALANTNYFKSFGGKNMDWFKSVVPTSDGGFVAVGFSDSKDQDLFGINIGGTDAVIVKYDNKGNIQWKKVFGGSGEDNFEKIAVTKDGGYIVVGNSSSSDKNMYGLNKGNKQDYMSDAIIIKYDKNGNIQWKKSFGGSLYDRFKSVVVTNDGGYVVVGYSSSNDKDMYGLTKGNINWYQGDAIIVKYDENGNLIWKKSFGGRDDETLNNITIDNDGGFIAVGYTNSSDGDIKSLNKGDGDAVIVKFDKNANIIWSKTFGGSLFDSFEDVTATNDGYVVVGLSESEDEDMKKLNKGYCDALIVKYRKDGKIIWKKTFGGSGFDSFSSIIFKDRGFFIVGHSGSSDKDLKGLLKDSKDAYEENSGDALLIRYNLEGRVEWVKTFGGSYMDDFEDIALLKDGELIAVGASASKDKDMKGLSKDRYADMKSDAIILKYCLNVTSISLNIVSKNINVSESFNLKVNINPSYASNPKIGWSSSNVKVAIVDNNGKVTAVSPGKTIIVAKSVDGGKIAKCTVVVNPIKVSGVKLNTTSLSIKKGGGFSLSAVIIPNNAFNKKVKWMSSNSKIVRVDNCGKLRALQKGIAIITVKTIDGGYKANCKVMVQ